MDLIDHLTNVAVTLCMYMQYKLQQ